MSSVLYLDRTGARPFEHEGQFLAMLDSARVAGGGPLRTDGADVGPTPMAMSDYTSQRNAEVLDAWLAKNPKIAEQLRRMGGVRIDDDRVDAFGDAGGAALARDLDYVHARVLEEKAKPTNAMRQFRTGDGIPLGARTHTVRRFLEHGEAGWYRGSGTNVKSAGYRQKEQQFPVRYVVTSVATSVFELLSTQFAGINDYERKLRAGRRAIDQFVNAKLWNGDEQQNYYGVINYPWLAKRTTSTRFDGSETAADVVAALNEAANFPEQQSGGVFAPNRMVTSPRVANYLRQTQFSTASEATIAEYFLRNQDAISQVEKAYELADIGGTGVDGILFYNDDEDAIAHETAGGLQILPQQSFGFDNITYMYLATGGIVMRDSGHNVLLLVEATTSASS